MLQSLGIFITSNSKHWSRFKTNLELTISYFLLHLPPLISPHIVNLDPPTAYSPPNWWRLWMAPYILDTEFRPSTKKVCSSDVMHCQISIFELKMMVKIGVIFMPFSNPTCHFRATADFTVCTVCTWWKVSCSSEMAHMIWKWHENDTYFHQHI